MSTESRPFLAFAWMLGAVASFSLMAVGGREIAVNFNTFELMLYRSVIGFVIVASILAYRRDLKRVRTNVVGLHFQRNIIHFMGQNLWFYGVAAIPLSQLVALEFTNPIWVAILAPLLLREAPTLPRILAACLGFIGVLVVARPGIAPVELGHLAGLGAAICFALNTIFTKRLMAFDAVLTVMFWMTLMQTFFSLILALPGGIPVPANATEWGWIAVLGLCGLSAHVSLTTALSCAPASLVAPMEFIRLPVITLIGFFLYSEPIVIWVGLGAVLIITGNLINLFGEARSTKKRGP